jgi:hypothetical protein
MSSTIASGAAIRNAATDEEGARRSANRFPSGR